MPNSPDYYRMYNYNLTPERYAEILAEQEGVCGICRGPVLGKEPGKRVSRGQVDHDHDTGEVRGILCHGCNTGIGSLKDDPNTLRAAIAYLERTSPSLLTAL